VQKPRSKYAAAGGAGGGGGGAAGGSLRKKDDPEEDAATWGSDADDEDDGGGDDGDGGGKKECPLASLRLWRVVLDEAHVARNRNTSLCRALGRLRCERRLAMSGTPIQNGLSDLYSLLRWLKVPSSPSLHLDAPDTRAGEGAAARAWAVKVSRPLRSARNPQARTLAFARLNALLAGVLIRRVKTDAIGGARLFALAPITYDDQHAPFSEDEEALYDTLWSDAVACFNRHLKAGDVLKNYIFILVKLLRVRQACAHPALVVVPRDVCGACRKPLGAGGPSGKLRVAPCGHAFCAECIEARIASGGAPRRRGRGGNAGAAGGSASARKAARTFKLEDSSSSDDADGDADADGDVIIVTPAAARAGGAAGGKPGLSAAQQRCKCPLPDCEEIITVRPQLILPCALFFVPMPDSCVFLACALQRDDLAPYSRDEDADLDAVGAGGAAIGGPSPAKAPPVGPPAGGFEMSTKIATLLRGLAAYAHTHAPHARFSRPNNPCVFFCAVFRRAQSRWCSRSGRPCWTSWRRFWPPRALRTRGWTAA
jgi:hypothetical protein